MPGYPLLTSAGKYLVTPPDLADGASVSLLTDINGRAQVALKTLSVSPADYTTTDNYADVTGSLLDTQEGKYTTFTIKNTHATNAIKWKVLASNDNSTFVEVKAEAVVAAVSTDKFEPTIGQMGYRYYKVQAASNVAATPGTAQVRGYSKA